MNLFYFQNKTRFHVPTQVLTREGRDMIPEMNFDVLGFIRAIYWDWISLMSGIVSVILTAWGFSKDAGKQRRMFWSAAVITFLVALVRVWTMVRVS